MREQIPIVAGNNTYSMNTPDARLGNLAYWREHFRKLVKEDVETYLGRQNWDQQEEIMRTAKDFHRNDKPLAATVSLIPVAAHQESERIMSAMAEFARQRTDDPFSVLLYLNAPSDSKYYEVQKTLAAVEQAKSAFPNVDIRSTNVRKFSVPIIGKIRKNLWDSATYLAYYDGLFDNPGDVIAFNQDIDTEWMERTVVRNVQKYYDVRRHNTQWTGTSRLRPAGTQLRHAYDHERPNVSKVVQWHDLVTRVQSPAATFEAGLVVPLSTYVRSNGMNENNTTHETHNLVQVDGLSPRIKHTLQFTSPRRFGDRLHDTDIFGVWKDDSFGADDTCRTNNRRGDISPLRAQTLIRESLNTYIPLFFQQPIIEYPVARNDQKLIAKLEKRKHLAISVLKRLDESGELAEIAGSMYSTNDMMKTIKSGKLPFELSVN
jgi:hypothetical protein